MMTTQEVADKYHELMSANKRERLSKKMKAIKLISWFLGIGMFMFGILKVLSPTIHGWFIVQMTNSGLAAYIPVWVGIAGEIVVGSALLLSLLMDKNLAGKNFKLIVLLASAAILPMMAT